MNTRTKDDFIGFIEAVESLTAACVIHIGMDTASEILTKCNALKVSLIKDETIAEVR